MPWFRVDDKFHEHPKVRKLQGDRAAALGVWIQSGSWAADNLTDGFVPAEVVRRFDAKERYARRLVAVGLWLAAEHEGESGYRFHDWEEYQPSRSEVAKQREDTRDRVRRWRKRNGQNQPPPDTGNGDSNVAGNALRNGLVTAPPNPHPVPNPNPTKQSHPASLSPVDQYARNDQRRTPDEIPEDWAPHDLHRALATQRGVNCEHEAAQFRAHAKDKARVSANWNSAFDSWLGRAGLRPGGHLRAVAGDPAGVHRDPKTGRVVEW